MNICVIFFSPKTKYVFTMVMKLEFPYLQTHHHISNSFESLQNSQV